VALCTNNNNDPIEKADAARRILRALHHAFAKEPVVDMKRSVVAALRTRVAATDVLIVEQHTEHGLDDDIRNTPLRLPRRFTTV
jgi:hypothetical protein